MYLTKVRLNPGRLDNAWEWHRALWTLFPDIKREPNEPSPFLFRLESLDLVKGAQVLMQSTIKPLDHSGKAQVLAKKVFEPKFSRNQLLRFSLTANVTKKIRDQKNNARKLRVPLIKESDQIDWAIRKFENLALVVTDQLQVQNHPPVYFLKGRRPGKIITTSFEGVIQIQDAQAVYKMLEQGVGAAKAFGCGLLLVRRA